MFPIILERLKQGHRTSKYPAEPPKLPDRFRGLPVLDSTKCPDGCRECAEACPTLAIEFDESGPKMDLGKCLFCTDCMQACPEGAIGYTQEYRLCSTTREGLVYDGRAFKLAEALDTKITRLFSRSLKLRQVSAAGCNGCEADTNVLNTIGFDLSRFGIQFLASPRHCDGVLVTGPVSQNMKYALEQTYAAVPAPKIVIAVGACAISGGPFIGHAEQLNGADKVIPVDLYIPGCPPHPMTILDGLLRMLDRLEDNGRLVEVGNPQAVST
jgi:Ni,Fe-hydrogenase III small subunit/formate hydrogenlyase subunit 6/NADH:ubiquinone oxidoreductase subunit I